MCFYRQWCQSLVKDHVKVDIYLNRHGIQLISGEDILAQNFIKVEK